MIVFYMKIDFKRINQVFRLIYLPYGLIQTLFIMENNAAARDIDNKRRYSSSIIDKGCSFTPDCKIGKKSHILEKTILNHTIIGDYTYIGRNSLIQNCVIGNYCSISHEVILGLGTHPLNLFSTSPLFYRKRNTFNIQIIQMR